ncbi:MAG: transglycosylase SLT domain-containing protein [Candidatus Levybacteria bacterium]|nr:transglycosylase SLT domain-containing protein [Candidatus Levybacteria bacterium]
MLDEARETRLPFKPERTTTRIRNRKNPQGVQKRLLGNRYVPLRTKIAGLAGAAALTFFGGEKIADQVLSDTNTAENPGATVKIDQLPSQDKRIIDLRAQTNSYIFKDLTEKEKEEANREVREMDQVIFRNPSFKDMVRVVSDNESYINQVADKYTIPRAVAYGIVLIENGGAADLISPAGAVGPAQLMKDAAIEMGLRVDDDVDERLDPAKAFDAMVSYIAKYRDLFGGNLGIAVWNYHAGPGNVGEAIRLYFLDAEGIDIGELNFKVYSDLIKKRSLDVHRLLNNPRVRQQLLPRLEDETELYPAKAASGAYLYPLYKEVR